MTLSAIIEELRPFAAVRPATADAAAAEPAAVQAAAPTPVSAAGEVSYAAKGYHADVTVTPSSVVSAAGVLLRHEFLIEAIAGVDWIQEDQLEVVYDFFHTTEGCRVVLRLRVGRTEPEVPTISGVFSGAEWHERETHDFFGIIFSGLKDLGPFLLPEDATFHPLLKDYAP
jgi:NADH-quinone oxidoreductase subunit C